jgi:ribosome-associated protein
VEALDRAQQVVEALEGKRALDTVVLDLRGLTIITDYFVIATGSSSLNINAQVDAVLDTVKPTSGRGIRAEGQAESGWVLLDLGDVVVHVLDAERRDFYGLERLWADAPRVALAAATALPAPV